jgi:hypothetical protein
MSKKNQNSTTTQEENIAVEETSNFSGYFNNSNMRFKHTHKDVSITIEANKLFIPQNKQEEDAILDFAGSKASVFNGKSVIVKAGKEKVFIEGADFYKAQITTLEAELNGAKEEVKQLKRQLEEAYGQVATSTANQ